MNFPEDIVSLGGSQIVEEGSREAPFVEFIRLYGIPNGSHAHHIGFYLLSYELPCEEEAVDQCTPPFTLGNLLNFMFKLYGRLVQYFQGNVHVVLGTILIRGHLG